VTKVLIVDDSALVRKLFGAVLASESDFEVAFARHGLEALQQLDSFKPDVITLDVHMPRMNGLECLDRIMLERPCPVVMVSSLTAEGAEETLEALRLGAIDFVAKPEGAVSLKMAAFGPKLVEKIRAAATAKVRSSRRLRERVQHRIGGSASANAHRNQSASALVSTLNKHQPSAGLVVIGVSTGGPPALDLLLSALPSTFPCPIVIAQHMPASFTGPLARRLDGICEIRVQEVQRVTALESGCAYIARGDADMIIARRPAGLVAMSAPSLADYPWHPSTDRLVKSAMEHVPAHRLVGVLLTGMGDDGAAAMTQLHRNGGRTIAESEETAVIWGMPGALANAGGADWVVALPDIADLLQKLAAPNAAYS
jgi:two-component system chemotaxis response regulator CheB